MITRNKLQSLRSIKLRNIIILNFQTIKVQQIYDLHFAAFLYMHDRYNFQFTT